MDHKLAIRHGFASLPESTSSGPGTTILPLKRGQDLYLEHAGRSPLIGGTAPKTPRRYKNVLDKFVAFALARGVSSWHEVHNSTLEAYLTDLYEKDYAPKTIETEATTVKQTMSWLISRKLLPESSRLDVSVTRAQGTTTYCYSPEEVTAILDRCDSDVSLHWLRHVVTVLCNTGFRISEAAALRWDDVDLKGNFIRLTDDRGNARHSQRPDRRGTKSGKSRSIPISPPLRELLTKLPRLNDGLVLHAAKGGRLDDDKVRVAFIRDVINPLSIQFDRQTEDGKKTFSGGRLHSFRHYFISRCANTPGITEHQVMQWVGHSNSAMITHYFHLNDLQSQQAIMKLTPVTGTTAEWLQTKTGALTGDEPAQAGH